MLLCWCREAGPEAYACVRPHLWSTGAASSSCVRSPSDPNSNRRARHGRATTDVLRAAPPAPAPAPRVPSRYRTRYVPRARNACATARLGSSGSAARLRTRVASCERDRTTEVLKTRSEQANGAQNRCRAERGACERSASHVREPRAVRERQRRADSDTWTHSCRAAARARASAR